MNRYLLPLLLVIISLVGLGRLGFEVASRRRPASALVPVHPARAPR